MSLYLLEVSYTDKESQALYDSYTDEVALISAIETKLGQAMKSEAMKAELLIAFDTTGRVIAQHYHSKDEDVVLSNRLVWVTTDGQGETPNLQKYDSYTETEANYHLKRGAAMGNADVSAILIMIVNVDHVGLNDYWVRPV